MERRRVERRNDKVASLACTGRAPNAASPEPGDAVYGYLACPPWCTRSRSVRGEHERLGKESDASRRILARLTNSGPSRAADRGRNAGEEG